MWLLFGILTALSWGAADLFYKKGSDERDSFTQFKIVIMVGLVMGIHAMLYMIHMAVNGEAFNPYSIIVYLPVSAMYILSMLCGYIGLRYIALSVSSPIQNSSGALVAIMCFVILRQSVSKLQLAGIVLICGGVFALSMLENRQEKKENGGIPKKVNGIAAIAFPLIYCLVDAGGTFLDDIWLNEDAPKLSEGNALVAYELTFFLCCIVVLLYIVLVKKEKFKLSEQRDRGLAALFETAGQFFYVFIIGGSGIIVAPLVSAYCVVSMLLSAVFLKEKLSKSQYVVAGIAVAGIILLAVAEEI